MSISYYKAHDGRKIALNTVFLFAYRALFTSIRTPNSRLLLYTDCYDDIPRQCKNCGTDLHKRSAFCSEQCRSSFNYHLKSFNPYHPRRVKVSNIHITKKCAWCDNAYLADFYRETSANPKKSKFCAKSCADAWHANDRLVSK